jgi:hypothetical protein
MKDVKVVLAVLISLLLVLSALPVRVGATTLPTYIGTGGFTSGAASITPSMPGSIQPFDILILVVTSENEAISLTTANGFAEVSCSPQSAGTAATDPASRLAVYWKRAVGSDSSPVVADSGNNNEAEVFLFRGVVQSGNPWEVCAGGNDSAANDTSANIPGGTTTIDNQLIVLIESTSFNGTSTAECGTMTNANLASITERDDNSNTIQLGGGLCLGTGTLVTHTTYATTTLTMANTTNKGAISLSLQPSTCIPGSLAMLGVGTC